MVQKSLAAAKLLQNHGISARVIDIHTIKPIDREILIGAAKECGCVVTAEEHFVNGGLGGAVAEVLSKDCPVPMEFVGVEDTFAESGDSRLFLPNTASARKHRRESKACHLQKIRRIKFLIFQQKGVKFHERFHAQIL
jgi:transketolase